MSLLNIRHDMARIKSQRTLTIIYEAHTRGRAPMVIVKYAGWHDPDGSEREFGFASGSGDRLGDAAHKCWTNFQKSLK